MTIRNKTIISCAACGFASVLVIASYLYAHYPSTPDLKKVDVITGIKFIATDDFKHLATWHQQRYATDALARLNELELKDILALMMQQDGFMKDALNNVRSLPDGNKIAGELLRVFLDKFYKMNKTQRKAALTVLAYAQQGEMGQHPEKFGLPSAEKFKTDMARFLANQPPLVQGQMGQFLIDLRAQRDAMGLPQPN